MAAVSKWFDHVEKQENLAWPSDQFLLWFGNVLLDFWVVWIVISILKPSVLPIKTP